MADDYSINAKITADASGYEAGVKKAQKASQTLSKSVSGVIQGLGKSGLVGALGAVGLATGGVTAIIGVAKKAFQAVSKAVNECTEAYKTQYKAEVALETVAKNNPYIDGSNVRALKNFASEIQAISNYGDEELLPLISNLTALGRTQEETMQIIKVATDMASTGMVSLDTAVNQLNMTLNGNIGRLGVQNAELKTLTKEELASGKAVELLGKKYEGLAKSTVDTSKQLKNAIGDFKELLGQTFENAFIPMRKWFTEVITNTNNAIKSAREQKKAYKEVFEESGEVNLKAETESMKIALDQALDEQRRLSANYRQYLSLYGDYIDKDTDEILLSYEAGIKELNAKIAKMSQELTKRKNETEAQAEKRRQEQADAEAEQELIDLKQKYLDKIDEQERKWKNITKVTGEEIDLTEKLKFYQDTLVSAMTESNGQITSNNQFYKDQMATIEKINALIEAQAGETADISSWEDKILQQQIERLQAMKELEMKNADTAIKQEEIQKRYNNLVLEVKLEQMEKEKELELQKIEGTTNAEEARLKILKYYSEQERLLRVEANKVTITEVNKQTEKETKKTWKEIAKTIVSEMKKVASVISRTFSTVKSMFLTLFDFNIDDALNTLLKFEDKVLTFFVETLPQLPSYFESALQSVAVLLENVMQIATPERIASIISDIMKTIAEFAPRIIDFVAQIILNMLQGITDSIPQILETLNVVVEKLAEYLPQLIQQLIEILIGILKEPKKIADLVVSLIRGFVEIFNVLIRNIAPLLEALLPAIGTIIVEIIKAIPSLLESLAKSIGDAILAIGKWIVNLLIDAINLMLDGISKVWDWIPNTKSLPHIPHFESGTNNAPRGLAIVGEAGPELVSFGGGEKVFNNTNTQKILSGKAGNDFTVNFYNTIDTTAFAMMNQLKQYNRQMAINGVI